MDNIQPVSDVSPATLFVVIDGVRRRSVEEIGNLSLQDLGNFGRVEVEIQKNKY